jgi:hypothetical protein
MQRTPPSPKRARESSLGDYEQESSRIKLLNVDIPEAIKKTIECPICLSLPKHSAVQCANGHIFCADCIQVCEDQAAARRTKVLCATCRTTMEKPYVPSTLANALLLSITDVCKHCGIRPDSWIDLHTSHNDNCPLYLHRKVQETDGQGIVYHFSGLQGKEAVRSTFDAKTQTTIFFDGPPRQERMIKKSLHNGSIVWFEGEAKNERMIQLRCVKGGDTFYEGDPGKERLVKRIKRNFTTSYLGPKGEERVVTMVEKYNMSYTLPGARIWRMGYFEGGKGKELCVRIEDFVKRCTELYEGSYLNMRKVRAIFHGDGRIEQFEGGKGKERKVRTLYKNGWVNRFSGEAGHEYRISESWELSLFSANYKSTD